jgi:hypothetical protein
MVSEGEGEGMMMIFRVIEKYEQVRDGLMIGFPSNVYIINDN